MFSAGMEGAYSRRMSAFVLAGLATTSTCGVQAMDTNVITRKPTGACWVSHAEHDQDLPSTVGTRLPWFHKIQPHTARVLNLWTCGSDFCRCLRIFRLLFGLPLHRLLTGWVGRHQGLGSTIETGMPQGCTKQSLEDLLHQSLCRFTMILGPYQGPVDALAAQLPQTIGMRYTKYKTFLCLAT